MTQMTCLKLVLPTIEDVPTDTLQPHWTFTCWLQDTAGVMGSGEQEVS